LIHGVPRVAVVCALIAVLNAVCWSLITPPFQVPDEPAHFAYVKQLAETGSPPHITSEYTSPEEIATIDVLRFYKIRQRPQVHSIASASAERMFERQLKEIPRSHGSLAAGVATSQPPLYYALEIVPYDLAGNVLDRLQLMRLLSAAMAALTAIFVFLFLREALPAEPWTWTVGALSIALVPLLGFMSGAVNPDTLLFGVSAATFYVLARAFRRGLNTGAAAAIGGVAAIGLLTKLNYLGFLPGIFFAVVALALREPRASRRARGARVALAIGLALSPAVAYVIRGLVTGLPLGVASAALGSFHGPLGSELDYIWQLYLPRLPGTSSYFPGLFTQRMWFERYVGLYGWLDTQFPNWVYNLALIPTAAIALLAGRALFEGRAALRRRAVEIAVYAVMAIGLLFLIGTASYQTFPLHDAEFIQSRYLLPLVPLLGAVLVLGARGAGRRWGPVAGTLIVVAFLAHDIFSQLLVVGRYYG
jgi:4-amino-4-deoxy-L-arabinose transferase-like glycosyltransferase